MPVGGRVAGKIGIISSVHNGKFCSTMNFQKIPVFPTAFNDNCYLNVEAN
jgi:hypothetical protein